MAHHFSGDLRIDPSHREAMRRRSDDPRFHKQTRGIRQRYVKERLAEEKEFKESVVCLKS